MLAVAVVGCLCADLGWYFTGRRQGRRVLRLLCRISLSPDSCVRQTEAICERWGAPSLMVAKFVPGFAEVATSMAGLMRTRWLALVFFDAIGALLWSGVAVGLGQIFRDAVGDVIAAKALQRYQLIRTLRMARVSVDELHRTLAKDAAPLIVDVRPLAGGIEAWVERGYETERSAA